jgi:hypothetical protein
MTIPHSSIDNLIVINTIAMTETALIICVSTAEIYTVYHHEDHDFGSKKNI